MGVRADVVVGDRLRVSRGMLQEITAAVRAGDDVVVVRDCRRDEEAGELFLTVQRRDVDERGAGRTPEE